MKWDEEFPPHNTVRLEIKGRKAGRLEFWQQWLYLNDPPNLGAIVDEILNTEILIGNASNGRSLRHCTLLQLALERLQQSGLSHIEGPLDPIQLACPDRSGMAFDPGATLVDMCANCGRTERSHYHGK